MRGKDHSEDSGVEGRIILQVTKCPQGVIGAGVAQLVWQLCYGLDSLGFELH